MKSKKVNSQKFLVKLFVLIFTIHFSLFTFNSFSQNVGISINTTGAPPNNAAILDVSSTSLGVLVPRMTALERNAISSPVPESLLIYNTDSHCFEAYYNGGWVAFGCLGGCQVPTQPTPGTNTSSQTSIVWNWSTVNSSTSYKWSTTTAYISATDNGTNTTYTQTGLTCNTPYTLYVWAYNSCGNSSYAASTQTTSACTSCGSPFTDSRDGQSYNTVLIGTQCWMAQNLNYGSYEVCNSGNEPQAAGAKFCQNLSGVADNTCPMGGLYEWTNMMNISNTYSSISATPTPISASEETCNPCGSGGVQGLCPTGWHIPTSAEWTTLTTYLSGSGTYYCGGTTYQIGKSVASTSGWTTSSTACTVGNNENTNNSSSFNALPDGYSWSGSFSNASTGAEWWTATEYADDEPGVIYAIFIAIYYTNAMVGQIYFNKPAGASVRCIHN